VVDNRLSLNFSKSDNRDQNCGNCLRGTTFTPDNKNILIAKMGGNGIAIIDVNAKKYVGTITGSYQNLRHLVINQDQLILSSNKFGFVQKAKIDDILTAGPNQQKQIDFKNWQTVKVGTGARTIDVTKDGKIIFACVNNESKVAVIDAESMKVISELRVASFPVGMSLSPDDKQLIITSQGKSGVLNSGNTVNVFDVVYSKK
jgi:DNA-binding beta-propeller fold protein YncE